MTDEELGRIARRVVDELYPSDQKELLSVNKQDMIAGFVLGARTMLEILDLNIRKAGP